MTDEAYHTPVLRDEVLEYLRPVPDGTYVDATLGGGGHAESIAERLSPQRGRLVAFDRDGDAIRFAEARLQQFGERITFVQDNFSHLHTRLLTLGIGGVDGVVFDLGVSSFQIDQASRGFSFQRSTDSRLDMRMDQSQGLDAHAVLNEYDQERLAEIFWKYGEERHSRKIARAIVEQRKRGPIATAAELDRIIGRVAGGRFLQKSLARVFQALRIEVNHELDNLRKGLRGAVDVLRPGGRVAVIAYHSLEDRIVKEFFREESRTLLPSGSKYIPDTPVEPRLRVLTRKPVTPGDVECLRNPRARSAKLRAAEKV